MNLQSVLNKALLNNGISYSINYGNDEVNVGYMVSKFGCETISQTLNLDIVINYVKHNLNELCNDEAYLGIWLTDGNWYLDVSFNILDLNEAIQFAKDNKQLAIWDCANKCEIKISL
jgi:hypothetical protein